VIPLSVTTSKREEMRDVTAEVRRVAREQGWQNGAVLLHCPHTTGAVTINEGADPDVQRDIVTTLRALIPHHGDYHHAEGNSDAHLKSSLVGCGQLVILENGELMLGTWQRIFFCEFDGPRSRKLWVQFLPG